MATRSLHRVWTIPLLIGAVASAACASGSGVSRATAFPTIPTAPHAVRPALFVPSATIDASSIVKTALDLRGVAYRIGGEARHTGFDCSGLVRFAFSAQRVELPRTVAEQFRIGTPVTLARVRAGDLIFFSTTAKGATHVGIAVGSAPSSVEGPVNNDAFVHAPARGGAVRVDHLGNAYWRARFVGARRLF